MYSSAYAVMLGLFYDFPGRLGADDGGKQEIGILNLSGDLGNWLSDVVPSQENWIAKLVSAAKQTATSKQ